MRKISPISALVYIASMAALLIVLIPGLASAAVPTSDDIWRVVSVAKNDNQQVLNSFAVNAVQAADVNTLASLRQSADQSLENTYYNAEAQIKALVEANQDLVLDGEAALNQLLSDHNEAHAEVADIYATVHDALSGTSTTTTTTAPPTTTTTTTSVPETTTTTAPKSTTTVPPTTTTTSVPETTTTSTVLETTTTVALESDSTTTTTLVEEDEADSAEGEKATAIGSNDPEGPTGSESALTTGADDMAAHIDAMGEGQLWGAPPAVSPSAMADNAMPPMTAAVSHAASVLLPPTVVTIAVAPLLVLEVLVRTIFDSARSLALPALLLTAVAGWFVWKERKAADAISV